MLIRKGVETPSCAEMLNLTAPEIVLGIHREFVSAGANVIETNTFGANSISLAKHRLSGECARINAAAVSLARQAVGDSGFVALSVGPTGKLLRPLGEIGATELFDAYFAQAKAGIDAGADAVIIETMGDIAEARIAAIAAIKARGCEKIAIIASFTFEGERLMTGGSPECAALILEAVGADALGVNCSGGPEQLEGVVRRMRALSNLPIIAQPNAGIPSVIGGKTVFPLEPQEMAEKMEKIVAAGANAIGGCCGTTPEHIRLMKPLLEKIGEFLPQEKTSSRRAVTPRKIFEIEEIGEIQSLEPTVDGLYDADPDSWSVSIDVGGLSFGEIEELILEAQQFVKTPILFEAEDSKKLDFALKIYCGIALTRDGGGFGAVKIQEKE